MENALPVVLFLAGVLVTLIGYVFVTSVQDLKRRVASLESSSLKESTYTDGVSKIESLYKDLSRKFDSLLGKLEQEYVHQDVCTADKLVMSAELQGTLKAVEGELGFIKSEMTSIGGILKGLTEWKSYQEGVSAGKKK